MTHTITYEVCCEHGELLDKYCAKCDQGEPMTHTCKCKSESERLLECVDKLNQTFHTTDCWASMITSTRPSRCVRINFYQGYGPNHRAQIFESVDAFEAWANSVCDNPYKKILHRKFKL